MEVHVYFISFSHSRGFGNYEVGVRSPITSIEHIKDIAKLVEERSGLSGVAVLNYQLLRTEPGNPEESGG